VVWTTTSRSRSPRGRSLQAMGFPQLPAPACRLILIGAGRPGPGLSRMLNSLRDRERRAMKIAMEVAISSHEPACHQACHDERCDLRSVSTTRTLMALTARSRRLWIMTFEVTPLPAIRPANGQETDNGVGSPPF